MCNRGNYSLPERRAQIAHKIYMKMHCWLVLVIDKNELKEELCVCIDDDAFYMVRPYWPFTCKHSSRALPSIAPNKMQFLIIFYCFLLFSYLFFRHFFFVLLVKLVGRCECEWRPSNELYIILYE